MRWVWLLLDPWGSWLGHGLDRKGLDQRLGVERVGWLMPEQPLTIGGWQGPGLVRASGSRPAAYCGGCASTRIAEYQAARAAMSSSVRLRAMTFMTSWRRVPLR